MLSSKKEELTIVIRSVMFAKVAQVGPLVDRSLIRGAFFSVWNRGYDG